MKPSSIRYLIKEGFSNIWVNRLMSLASVGVLIACMVIIGLAILIADNVNAAIGKIESQNVVMVYMKDYNWALYNDDDKASDTNKTSNADKTSKNNEDEASDNEKKTSDEEKTDEEDKENKDDKEDKKENEDDKPDENGIKSSDYIIHNEKEAEALRLKIEKIDNVKKAIFVSREDTLKDVIAAMPEGSKDAMTFDDKYGNPISYSVEVTMSDSEKFNATVSAIEKLEGVDEVVSQKELAAQINALKNGMAIAGFWIIAILIIISLVIVSNTIRVTMYNRKLEISIMKAVGATDAFVRIPFIVEGVTIGLISAVLSEALLFCCYTIASQAIENVFVPVTFDYKWAIIMFVVFAAIGVAAGTIGSVIMISKYLRKEGSVFAAI